MTSLTMCALDLKTSKFKKNCDEVIIEFLFSASIVYMYGSYRNYIATNDSHNSPS